MVSLVVLYGVVINIKKTLKRGIINLETLNIGIIFAIEKIFVIIVERLFKWTCIICG